MFDETRLQRLIDAYFDQQLQAGEKHELEAMLLSSARAREIFMDHAEWHGLTREVALRENASVLMGENQMPPTRSSRSYRGFWLGTGVAASLALAFSIFHFRPSSEDSHLSESRTEALQNNVALLGQALDVVWEDGSSTFTTGSALPKGWLKIRQGTLRLDFYSGARVYLQGPASLELISQDLARLDQGKLVANVPPPAEGFTVLSDQLRIVDRGTEFGMNVSTPGNCEVHVFDGEVEVHEDASQAMARSLYEGDAVSIRGGTTTSFSADRGSFTNPATLREAETRATESLQRSWQASSHTFRSTPDLLVYFDFEDIEANSPGVKNLALGANSDSYGTVIGCDLLTGRWSGKAAMGFAKTSDRIRFRLSGTTSSLTMMGWVRVDSLPLDHNALLSMAPDRLGEIHWKIDRSGKLLLGLRASTEFQFDSWERLESPPIVTAQTFGQWMHLATIIDGEARVMKHFVNGNQVASRSFSRSTPINLGMANLGNFDAAIPSRPEIGVVRNFNGRIDEFALIARALDAREIKAAAGIAD